MDLKRFKHLKEFSMTFQVKIGKFQDFFKRIISFWILGFGFDRLFRDFLRIFNEIDREFLRIS